MRAGPLANPKVIALLNAHFVPVYAANEDYRNDGAAPADERAEYQRIYREALAKKFSTGTVHVYLLTPDGHPFATLHVANASKEGALLEALEKAVADFKVPAGKPLIAPAPQSHSPQTEKDVLVLHLVSLGDHRGSWRQFPAENWIVYSAVEQGKLLPTGEVKPGATWDMDRDLATRLLTHFYPQTENNDVSKNRIEEQSLRATVVSIGGGTARARLEGTLRMEHWFYHKPDGNMVNASFSGYLDFDPATRRITALRLITDKAVYVKEGFAVGVKSL
jgi:hypothetical protein